MTRQQWEELFEKHEEPTDETHAEWLEELMIKQTVNELRRILGRVPVEPRRASAKRSHVVVVVNAKETVNEQKSPK